MSFNHSHTPEFFIRSRGKEREPTHLSDLVELSTVSSTAHIPVQRSNDPHDDTAVVHGGNGGENGGVEEGGDDADWAVDGNDSDVEGIKEVVSLVPAQEPFQPGSTPMNGAKRYLAYNMVGVIEVTDQVTHNVVNAQFHDRSVRTGYHFRDHFRYDLASLGERGAVYACQPTATQVAHVLYRPYGTWTSPSDWTYQLHGTTRILGVAAGGSPPEKPLLRVTDVDVGGLDNVVIATSDGELIFLTGGGIERACLTLSGTFVTMVAGREWVFLVTRDGSTTADGSQNLMGRLIRFDNFCTLQRDNLPVPKCHTLKWIGVTQEGAPAIYDSSGILNVMPHFRVPLAATWMRMLDTRRVEGGSNDGRSYWPVGVLGGTLLCLILRGQQAYPGFPRPLVQELPIRFPFKRADSQEARLEEQVARETMLLTIHRSSLADGTAMQDLAERELAVDKALIQLIRLACKGNRLSRAVDLICLLRHALSFDTAIKIANFYHLSALQKVIERLKNEREARDCSSAVVSATRSPMASAVGSQSEAQQTHSPLVSRLSVSSAVDRPSPIGSSAPKRAIDNGVVTSIGPPPKRLAASESAPVTSAMGKPGLIRSQGNPFLHKPARKTKVKTSLRYDTSASKTARKIVERRRANPPHVASRCRSHEQFGIVRAQRILGRLYNELAPPLTPADIVDVQVNILLGKNHLLCVYYSTWNAGPTVENYRHQLKLALETQGTFAEGMGNVSLKGLWN